MAKNFIPAQVPVGFAHRGGTDTAPESTDGAFAYAVGIGYKYLELDVHLSADGVVVVWHDGTLARVAGIDRAVSDMTWPELAEVRIEDQHRIVRLDDLLAQYPTAMLNIEPKHDEVVDPLISIIRSADASGRVCIGSFSDRRIKRLKSELGSRLCTSAGPRGLAKTLLAAYLYPRFKPDHQCVQVPVRAYGIAFDRPSLIDRLHRMGLQVHFWTINEEAEMIRLLDAGADGIMTDNVGLLKSVLLSRDQWVSIDD